MGVLTNIHAETPENLLFRTGTLTFRGVNLGALEGDITFRVVKQDFVPELAGAAGEVTGTRFRMGERAELQATLTEWQLQLIAYAIAGVDVSSNASSEIIGSSDDSSDEVGCIDDSEYGTVVYTTQQCDGLNSYIYIWNAIVDGDMEATFRDKGIFTVPVKFVGTYDPVDPNMRHWAVLHNTA